MCYPDFQLVDIYDFFLLFIYIIIMYYLYIIIRYMKFDILIFRELNYSVSVRVVPHPKLTRQSFVETLIATHNDMS